MNLKILAVLILYYTFILLAFVSSEGLIAGAGFNNSIELNSSALGDEEVDLGGLFGTGISLGRFIGLVGFGIGFPSSVPLIFRIVFGAFQTGLTLFVAGWFMSSLWDG